jgi:NAD kinase
VVIVTRKTALDELVERFSTKAQARFYLEQAGQDFEPILQAHARQQQALTEVRRAVPRTIKSQVIDRQLVPRFTFGTDDLVVTVGQDGLVSNTAKYLKGQPIFAVNPDPACFDGVLLPFTPATVAREMHTALYETVTTRSVTLAEVRLSDGQRLLAFNDVFIGARSHVSARYRIEVGDRSEFQSSSGIIVSTGAGSTGWLRSVYAGAVGVIEALGGQVVAPPDGGRFQWDADHLVFSVREPFPSVATETSIVHGIVTSDTPLHVISKMPENGVIFSDGVESDYLEFRSGSELTVATAPDKARLVVPAGEALH